MIDVSFVDRIKKLARTDFTIMFSEFEYSTGSICKSCYHANAKQVKATCPGKQAHDVGPGHVVSTSTH